MRPNVGDSTQLPHCIAHVHSKEVKHVVTNQSRFDPPLPLAAEVLMPISTVCVTMFSCGALYYILLAV
jgi:hypothetical protein